MTCEFFQHFCSFFLTIELQSLLIIPMGSLSKCDWYYRRKIGLKIQLNNKNCTSKITFSELATRIIGVIFCNCHAFPLLPLHCIEHLFNVRHDGFSGTPQQKQFKKNYKSDLIRFESLENSTIFIFLNLPI